MSYRLKPDASIASEVRRLIDKQLALAIAELRAIGDQRSDDAIHEARRHVKKVRAVLRLVQPTLGDIYVEANAHMRTANRLLAPIADGRAVVETLGHLRQRYAARLDGRTLSSIRSALIERSARIDRKAVIDRVLPRVATVLRAERRRIPKWTLTARGLRAIAPGLEKSMRRARRSMARVAAEPTSEHYHVWRRRVKDLWFQLRLLEARCANKLLDDQRRFEALDGCLGEYHNVLLLEEILVHGALVSRRQTARSLRLLRRYQAALRHQSLRMGYRIFREKPGHFIHREKRLWRTARPARHAVARRA